MKVIKKFQPEAILVWRSEDSLSGDRLGWVKPYARLSYHFNGNEGMTFLVHPCLQVMEVFQPEAIVVCGGADSLSGDRLGCFNLSLEGHSSCMEFLAKFGVPMLILGGGRVSVPGYMVPMPSCLMILLAHAHLAQRPFLACVIGYL